jgi:DNA (cytosine-5)-methyltransferase 1
MGFDAEWGVLSAADVGANHKRERIWICAEQRNFFSYPMHNRDRWRKQQSKSLKEKKSRMANTIKFGTQGQSKNSRESSKWIDSAGWWKIEPNVGRVANGVAFGLDRLKAIGNGQVPLCAATAWNLLKERLDGQK